MKTFMINFLSVLVFVLFMVASFFMYDYYVNFKPHLNKFYKINVLSRAESCKYIASMRQKNWIVMIGDDYSFVCYDVDNLKKIWSWTAENGKTWY